MNGLCMYLRRLHVTKPSTVGIRLGGGNQRFVVSKYSMQAKKKISGFLKMHSVLDAMPICSSIQVYQKQKKKVFRAMTYCKVCQMSSCGDGYNREFTFRKYALSECRAAGVSRMYYSPTDVVGDLPGPDEKGIRKTLGKSRLVADLHQVFFYFPFF